MAKVREEDIDLLREKADIVDVISSYTHLKRSGGHTFKGLCPFHSEKTPSFSVDSAKNLFHCFGCQKGGDVYRFVQEIENLPFPEAIEWLARRTGFELHYEEMSPGAKRAYGQKVRLYEANKEAAAFFHGQLMDLPAAGPARQYLGGRGFGKEVAERWQLGFAPGRNALCKHLLSKGFTNEEILAADLGRRSERDGSLYDTFRERITFPTWNLQGEVVGFGARALGDQQPKYLNTSETPVFSKSRVMYGLNRAKSPVSRGSAAVVVEGYTDVIALHEAGVAEAVATNGVALGESHFELLKKFTQRAVLMFDADTAGQSAAERGWGIDVDPQKVPMFMRVGLDVLVAPVPPGRDPADVVKEDGADAIRKVIDAAQPLLEFKLDQTLAKLPLDTPEARARAVREAAKVLSWHPDPIARHEYAFKVASRIGVDPETVQRALSEGGASGRASGGGTEATRDRRFPGHVKVEREALRLMLNRTAGVAEFAGSVEEDVFTSPPRRELFNRARASLAGDPAIGTDLFSTLSAEAQSLYTELSVGTEDDGTSEPSEIFVRLRVFALEREIKTRRTTLQELNPLVEATRHDELFTQLVGLEAERRDLLRSLQGAV